MSAVALTVPPKVADPYASHLPVLSLVARGMTVRSVLEFGGGQYSTPFFLNGHEYPDLKSLLTVESDPVWADRLDGRDHRHTVLRVTKETDALSLIEGRFDLIFVDGEAWERAKVARQAWRFGDLVIMHDAEERLYRQGLKDYRYVYFCNEAYPWTALATNEEETMHFIRGLDIPKVRWA